MRYFAKFKKEKEGGYSVNFPLLKGCFSEGNSYDEAKAMATEALSLWLESALEYDEAIPVPKEYFGEEYVAIKVPAYLAVKIQLKTKREKHLEKAASTTSKRLEVHFA